MEYPFTEYIKAYTFFISFANELVLDYPRKGLYRIGRKLSNIDLYHFKKENFIKL